MIFRFRKHNFRELVQRQMVLFREENHDTITQAIVKLEKYDAEPDPAVAGEHYQQFDDLSEDIEDFLQDMCDQYALTINDELEAAYRREFRRQSQKEFSRILPRRGAD